MTTNYRVVAVGLLIFSVAACGPSEKELAEQRAKAELAGKIEALQSKVSDTSNDPLAVQFRKIKFLGDAKGLCGEVNVKNNQGGYEGFRPFAVSSAIEPIILTSIPTQEIINISRKTAEERKKYIDDFSVKFALLGKMGQAVSIRLESEKAEKFKHWEECFAESGK